MLDLNPICVPPREDLALLTKVVREAGEIAKAAYHANDSVAWAKSDSSPVTDADIAVNDFLLKELRAARPDYGWLSEETKDDHSRHACPRSFVVDPIDGTRAFIDRTPNFAVSVAVIENGHAVAGAVFNPLMDEFYAASLGGGATLNGAPISVKDREAVDGITMIGYPRKFRRMGFPEMNCRVVNSMAYRMVLVGSAQADAALAFTPKSDWDIAAAALIVSEAGGVVTDLRGKAPVFDGPTTSGLGVICAGPRLHSLLLARVKPLIAQFETSTNKRQEFKHLGTTMSDRTDIQLLHLVIGGELLDPNKTTFANLKEVDFVGAFPNFEEAKAAWKSAAQRTVDNAHMRYFVLHAHELIDPDKDGIIG
ncbi:inositol monophosphatase family protein [Litorimonas sp. RW-G-Af-16]|uniref:inositol monophosphatase family protein n=1 Tax=Litorimonas sp. RW-G-Af-16 TaxID=3241168 RepID=UPI00390C5B95